MKKDVTRKRIKVIEKSKVPRVTKVGNRIRIRHTGEAVKIDLEKSGVVYLAVDCSGSMEGGKLTQAKQGAVGFAKEAKNKGYLTGLISFESSVTHLCSPQADVSILQKKLEPVTVGGGTNMSDAINLAVEKLSGKKGNRVIVVVTDGMPNEPQRALGAAGRAKKERIDIITIGTDDADYEFLKKLASRDDLATVVQQEQLEKGIVSTAQMLPRGK